MHKTSLKPTCTAEVDTMVSFDILKKKIAFFDLDGTVYLGSKIFDGVSSLFRKLAMSDVRCYFLSNNTSRSKADYVQLLARMDIACKIADIILPTDELLAGLQSQAVNQIYLLGTDALCNSFEEKGINTRSTQPDYVVVAFDKELTYHKLQAASYFIQQGVPYMATNVDMVCPSQKGDIPDTGAICQLLEATTGKRPEKIFGKPHPSMIAPYIGGVHMDDIVIVGDRTYTDMQLAVSLGCDFVLTLTGETKAAAAASLNYDKCYVVNSIADLIV